jgi:hypothetical protein
MADRYAVWDTAVMDDNALVATATGGIWLSPSLAAVAPADVAWTGIQELHYAALGDGGFNYTTRAVKLFPEQAMAAYANSLTSVLGQIGAVSPEAGNQLLGSLAEHIDLTGSMDGLEALGLAAFQSASQLGMPTPEMDNFCYVLGQLGVPEVSGGGVATSPVFDRGSGSIGFPSTQQLDHVVEQITGAAGASGISAQALQQGISLLAREGTAALGGASPEFRQVVNAVTSAGVGAVEGALSGSALPGVGTVAGAIIGGLIGLFQGLFGGSEHHSEGARNLAAGHGVTVENHYHIHFHGVPQAVGKDGSVGPAPAGAQGPGPTGPPSGQTLRPEPHKCEVGEGELDPGFKVPYWQDQALLLGSAAPIGPGLDGLCTQSRDGALLMARLPEVDVLGALESGGVVLQEQYEQLVRAQRAVLEIPPARKVWSAARTRLSEGGRLWRPVETVTVDFLEAEALGPDTPTWAVLRELRARYY